MARVHFLTVGQGDCTIIEHNSRRVSMIDICGGNRDISRTALDLLMEGLEKPRGNFAMCKKPTNPVSYLQSLGVKSLFRFILTHPEMDHLDGFDNLIDNIPIINFWDSGARKEKPDFKGSPYNEADWDRYVKVRDGKEEGVTVVTPLAGSRFQFANKNEDDHDGLYIASPSNGMIDNANDAQDFNDASYIISYWSTGGKIIIPGDAHDGSWEYVIQNHPDDIANCSFLLAPHHGRKSDRSYDFLNLANPLATLLGFAPSEELAYDACRNRGLYYFTQNQAGNVVLEIFSGSIEIYVENDRLAQKEGGNIEITNALGYYFLGTIRSG